MILFTGDCFLKTIDGSNPFSDSIVNLFHNANEVVINLETTVGMGGNEIEKAYCFQSHPSMLYKAIKDGITVFNIANNHSLDYGNDGLIQTVHNLESNKVKYIGTIDHKQEIIKVGNINVGLLACFGRGRLINPIDLHIIKEDIRSLKNSADRIVVCLHWGEEYSNYPSPNQQKLAHSLIDIGCDVIIGHHPHVMQGIERYHGGLIFYSLGNFNFNIDHEYHNKLITTKYAFCVEIDFCNNMSYKILPIYINDKFQPELFSDNKKVESYIDRISNPLKNNISKAFYLAHVSPHFFHNHLPSWKKRIKRYGFSHFRRFIFWLIYPSIWQYYYGLILSLFYKRDKF